jgi:hypothetical protein
MDVVPDGLVGKLVRPGGGIELRAEEDLLASPHELFVHFGRELVDHELLEPGVERRARNRGGDGVMRGSGASETTSQAPVDAYPDSGDPTQPNRRVHATPPRGTLPRNEVRFRPTQRATPARVPAGPPVGGMR